jgi:hypothetical protein
MFISSASTERASKIENMMGKKWKGLKTTWFGQKTRHGKGHIFGFKIW